MEKDCVICGQMANGSSNICSDCEQEISLKATNLLSNMRYPFHKRGKAGPNVPVTWNY
ncbi:MAG: hypothetical protein ACOX3A_04080 [bacterium]